MDSIRGIYKLGYRPSSSHTIGPVRATEQFMEWNPEAARFRVTLCGSLAETGKGHGTDEAIYKIISMSRLEILWAPDRQMEGHPNSMIWEALNASGDVLDHWIVFSVGGGDLKDDMGRIPSCPAVYELNRMTDILT